MTALTVHGPFRTSTGHGRHTREFVRELSRQGIAIELKDVTCWSRDVLPSEKSDPWFESLDAPVGSQIALHFCMPHQVCSDPDKLNVNFTMFEASRVHSIWVRKNLTHDLVILPTESSRRAWEDSGMPAHRIRLCPLGVDTSIFGPSPEASGPGLPRTRFLNVSEFNSRKNLAGLLRSWMRATRPGDDALLTIKTGRSFRTACIPAGLDRAAPVHILRSTLADPEMAHLYRAATHYVSASFGEGWDQPMMEAASTGLRLIAPDHSAYREYLDPAVATMIPARAVPVVYDSSAEAAQLFENAQWWEPDEEALAASIRNAIEGADVPQTCVRDRIVSRYSWTAAARRLIEILTELEPLAEKRRYVSRLLRSKVGSPAAERSPQAGPPDRDPA